MHGNLVYMLFSDIWDIWRYIFIGNYPSLFKEATEKTLYFPPVDVRLLLSQCRLAEVQEKSRISFLFPDTFKLRRSSELQDVARDV